MSRRKILRTTVWILGSIIVIAAVAIGMRAAFRWWSLDRLERRGERAAIELIDRAPPSPALPPDIAAIRRAAIRQAYEQLLTQFGDADLWRRYEQVRRWRPIVERHARPVGLDIAAVEAVMMAESVGDPSRTSHAGARGLFQVMDRTARRYVRHCGIANIPRDSYGPEQNTCVGVGYLQRLAHRHYRGDWESALAAYNWGRKRQDDALDWLARRWPGSPRSFWSLWEKKDPAFVATRSDAGAKRANNPEGWLLFNYGRNPNETRWYVPTVIAWESIIRYMDEHGRPPPRDGRASPRIAEHRARDATPWGSWDSATGMLPPAPTSDLRPPTSNVWYTARTGQSFGGIVINLLGESPDVVAALNPELLAADLVVTPGTRISLPEDRYRFHRASGRESYRAIARRYGMTTTELLRWSGRWTHMDAWYAAHRDCAPEGCDDERALASAGERLLVRRKH